MPKDWPSPIATGLTWARVLYAEFLTVIVICLLAIVASLPLVTVGSAILASVDVLTTVITRRDTGAPPSERARARLFVEAFKRNLQAGMPFSFLLIAVGGVTAFYYVVGGARQQGGLLLLALLGMYGVICILALAYRVGSFRARTSSPPSTVDTLRMAGRSFATPLSYTVLWLVSIAGLLAIATVSLILIPLTMFGVLAVGEVVAFEEVVGEGAKSVAPETGIER
ncbi:hypothetical protein [Halopiger aswanensis]|uniref:Uncharacterized protein n=1 Tax=Halopiger aswanensis TaxID=148449 RepID=A0A3R7HV03_9EURY|nr:hypothetical protein [Halopiger aswanensis]RKD86256.1 hypothetical protein ATJ93_4582 [Halopiger aswanensis]